jgi:hypothetical protein
MLKYLLLTQFIATQREKQNTEENRPKTVDKSPTPLKWTDSSRTSTTTVRLMFFQNS